MNRESSQTANLYIDEYVGRYLEDDLRKEGEKRAKELGSRSRIVDEGTIPIYPRSLWLTARLNYVLEEDVATILLSAAALEAALKVFLGRYFQRKLNVNLDLALDEMEIRSMIALSKTLGLLDEPTEANIRKIGDIRQEYVHSKIARISQKIEKELVARDEISADEWKSLKDAREMVIAAMAGQGDSYKILELLEQVYKGLYETSHYWKW